MSSVLPKLSESDFMEQVTALAELRGWKWVHVRTGRTKDSWRTPVSGPLGAGWPDLVMVRERDRRLIFAELKRDGGQLTDDQGAALAVLGSLMVEYPEIPEDFPIPTQRSYLDGVIGGMQKALREGPKVMVTVWRPVDWRLVEETLR